MMLGAALFTACSGGAGSAGPVTLPPVCDDAVTARCQCLLYDAARCAGTVRAPRVDQARQCAGNAACLEALAAECAAQLQTVIDRAQSCSGPLDGPWLETDRGDTDAEADELPAELDETPEIGDGDEDAFDPDEAFAPGPLPLRIEIVRPAPGEAVRGPVVVQARLVDDDGGEWAVDLQYARSDQSFGPATLAASVDTTPPADVNGRYLPGTPRTLTWVWASAIDAEGRDISGQVLRIRGRSGDGSVGLPVNADVSLTLRNDDDKDRVLLVAHPFARDITVGRITTASRPEVLRRFEIAAEGKPVTRIRFAPDGRRAALLFKESPRFVELTVGDGGALTVARDLTLAAGQPADVVYAPDGLRAYVALGSSAETGGGIVPLTRNAAFELTEGRRTALSLPSALAFTPGGRLLASGGKDFDTGTDYGAVSLSPDLKLLSRANLGYTLLARFIDTRGDAFAYFPDEWGGVVHGVELKPDGTFGRTFDIANLPSAFDVAVHPRGNALIVSRLDKNALTIVRLAQDGTGYEPREVRNVGLPAELDMIRTGVRGGLVVVGSIQPQATTARLQPIELRDDGGFRLGTPVELEAGQAGIAGDIAIQP